MKKGVHKSAPFFISREIRIFAPSSAVFSAITHCHTTRIHCAS